ncbi:uncharacterized protein PHALS_15463 [Plasmopara halstedii]|uniref:Uncharacterized protein n=1 Tax=Plasmopara halstedii TaxID=4781 RepID=A0A0P1A6I2_PLAHL|nr:uncharacterized protein PHALS_15463 [Plasmopara halstedii]CEG35777.1 hypothetical protein PHALS_15463 [Plasmopara halstedii]|eukprot:XP_024572146.1 hypothetical protein PHALS_15463 [Plasmopara halstedii]
MRLPTACLRNVINQQICVNKIPIFGLLKRQKQKLKLKNTVKPKKKFSMKRISHTTSFIKRDLSRRLHENVAVVTNIMAERIASSLNGI